MSTKLLYLALAVLASVGCREAEPRAQWTVVIATDAPVPQLGDRLLVEVLNAGGNLACEACRRVLSARDVGLWPLSFGVAIPPSGGEVRVRARLHRADHIGYDGLPSGNQLLDGLGVLPTTDTVLAATLVLSMRCFGTPSDPVLGTTCDPATGHADAAPLLLADEALPTAGSWPEAQPVDCTGDVPADMRCVKGGVMLLGDPHAFPTTGDKAPVPERLVKLGAFALDVDEATVGMVRGLIARGLVAGAPTPRAADPQSVEGACFYLGVADPTNDDLPVNCVSQPFARAVCEARGLRLPTEAELEWALGNLESETPYPWGHDSDVCAHAVVGLGRFAEAYEPEAIACRPNEDGSLRPWGPVVGGSDLDVTALGIKNLAGNMAEWAADRLAGYTDECWSGGDPALVDPRCDGGPPWSVRGSSWAGFKLSARAAARDGSPLPSNGLGFRCARTQ